MTDQPTTDKVAAGLAKSREAIENLINLYLDNVPLYQLDREQLAETVYEGLSDEFDRLYRITATAETLAERWEHSADRVEAAADRVGEGVLAATRDARGGTYRRVVRDLREVLATGQIPHDLKTTAELGG